MRDVPAYEPEREADYYRRVSRPVPHPHAFLHSPGGECCRSYKADKKKKKGKEAEGGETVAKDDPFIAEELTLAALMLKVFSTRWKEADALEIILEGSTGLKQLKRALQAAADSMLDVDVTDRNKPLETILTTTFKRGVGRVDATVYAQLKENRKFIVGRTGYFAEYYMDNYFTRIVTPALYSAVTTHQPDFSGKGAMRKYVERRLSEGAFDSSPYWRMVANNLTSKAHHYGLLKAAAVTGFSGYEFVAMIDNRTTELCKSLNGKRWVISDALDLMERAADADPEEAKEIMPWVSAADVKGKSTKKLANMGVMVPPLHANCRSTIRPIAG